MTLPADPVAWANKAFKDGRNLRIDRLEKYLRGEHPIAFATSKFRKTFGSTFESFAYNRLESVINAHSDRLQIVSLSSSQKGLGKLAQEHWDGNRMDVRENESTGDALSFGDSFIIVEADQERRGEVHYWINDPRYIRVHYSEEVPGERDLAAKRWVDEDKHAHLNLYFVDRVEKYISRNKTHVDSIVGGSVSWEKLEEESFELNVSDTVPVFHLANNARTNGYGRSEIDMLIPLQDALNFVLMSGMVATEFGAFAQKVIMGVKPEDDKEEAMLEAFKAGIDKILTLEHPDATIGEFSAANLQMFIDFAEFWDTTVSRVSRVPIHYLKMTGQPASGESFRMMEQPFSAKLEDRQRSFGYVYGEVARYGLRLTGKDVPPGSIDVNWASATPHSDEDKWNLVDMKVRAGLPFSWAIRDVFDEADVKLILKEREMERVQAQRFFDRGEISMGFGTDGAETEEETA